MPTRRGRVLLATSVVLYLLALGASTGELYALAAAAIIFPVAAIVFVRWGRHNLRFERILSPRRLFAGNKVHVVLQITNQSDRRSPPLLVEDDAPKTFGGVMRAAIPSLSRKGRARVSLDRRAQSRGRFQIGPLHARVVDPFGLASVQREVAVPSTVIVYPRVETLTEDAPPEARGGGGRSLIHRLAIAGDDLYGVRGWQDGDDLRKIHWRSTARRDEIMIRQDEIRPFPRATIFLDTRIVTHRDAGSSSSMEWAVTAAASMVWELARQGFALRLMTADSAPSPARWGREATDPLLAALAVVQRSDARSLVPALRRATGPGAGGAFLAIIAPPEEDSAAMLSRLRGAYAFRGAVLLDTASFRSPTARERAAADQRIAEAERSLVNTGWRVAVAGSTDKVRTVWQTLLAGAVRLPSSPSQRS